MKTYYNEKRARHYNRIWRDFSTQTQAVVFSLLQASLQRLNAEPFQPLHILDLACGTGTVLANFARLFPDAELYGVDASQPMLDQAASLLGDNPRVHLLQAALPADPTTGLPFQAGFFDVITCSNALHYSADPRTVLQNLGDLLAPEGRIVLEDYTLSPPWHLLEWAVKIYDPQHVELYSRSKIQEIAQQIGLKVLTNQNFQIDFIFRGWALLFIKPVSVS